MDLKKRLQSIQSKLEELDWEMVDLACQAHTHFLNSKNDEDMNRSMDLFNALCECSTPMETIIETLTNYQKEYE